MAAIICAVHLGDRYRGLRSLLLYWLLFFGVWLLLVDTTSMQELIAGGVVAMIAAVVVSNLQPADERTALAPPSRKLVLPPLVRIFADTALLARALLAHRRGKPLAGSFRTESLGSPRPAPGELVWLQWWGSVAPNRIVIDVDRRRGEALVHELVPKPESHS